MARPWYEEPNVRAVKPLPDVPGGRIDWYGRDQYAGVCHYPEESKYRWAAKPDILGRIECLLPPSPRLLVLGKAGHRGIKHQVDIDHDHGRPLAESMMASSSSSSASRL